MPTEPEAEPVASQHSREPEQDNAAFPWMAPTSDEEPPWVASVPAPEDEPPWLAQETQTDEVPPWITGPRHALPPPEDLDYDAEEEAERKAAELAARERNKTLAFAGLSVSAGVVVAAFFSMVAMMCASLISLGGGDAQDGPQTRIDPRTGMEVRTHMRSSAQPPPDEAHQPPPQKRSTAPPMALSTAAETPASDQPAEAEAEAELADEPPAADADTLEVASDAAPSEPAPVARPRSAPSPRTEDAARGTLKIRANRRVLVYVNDKAVGYTPHEMRVAPGAYSIRAMVPGQPDSEQTQEARLDAVGQAVALSFTF